MVCKTNGISQYSAGFKINVVNMVMRPQGRYKLYSTTCGLIIIREWVSQSLSGSGNITRIYVIEKKIYTLSQYWYDKKVDPKTHAKTGGHQNMTSIDSYYTL